MPPKSKTITVRVLVGTLPFHRNATTAPGASVRVGHEGDVLEVKNTIDVRRRIRAGDLAIVTQTKENQPATPTKAKE